MMDYLKCVGFVVAVIACCACASSTPGGRVELHLHLDGAVDSDLLLEVAQMRSLKLPGIGIPTTAAQIESLVDASSTFKRFDVVNNIMGGSLEAAVLVGERMAQRQAKLGVVYTELRYDPRRMAQSSYDNSSLPMELVVDAVSAGMKMGSEKHGVQVYTLLVAMRGESAARCFEIAKLAARMREAASPPELGSVVGLDLAGDEGAFNNSQYVGCLHHAKHVLGLNTTVHSGEIGAQSARLEDVRLAILEMNVDRIGHGYAAASDPETLALIKARNIHLEVCPGTALAEGSLDAIATFKAQNITNMGLNEDDPSSFFGGCDQGCVEAIAQTCSGSGLEVSPAAKALCDARLRARKSGAGLSTEDIERGYRAALAAKFS